MASQAPKAPKAPKTADATPDTKALQPVSLDQVSLALATQGRWRGVIGVAGTTPDPFPTDTDQVDTRHPERYGMLVDVASLAGLEQFSQVARSMLHLEGQPVAYYAEE